jgi:hypothetical protein
MRTLTERMQTIFSKVRATAMIPALAVAPMASAGSDDAVSSVVAISDLASLPTAESADLDSTSQADVTTISYHLTPSEWNREYQRRFEQLSIAEAYGKLSPAERHELEELTRARRHLKYPRSPEEVLWDIKQRKVTADLVDAIKAYAKFHDAPNSPRPTSKAKNTAD